MLKQSLVDLSEQNKQLTSENEQLQQQIKKLSEQLAQESADRLIDSQTKQAQLTELQQQLMTSIQLLKKSENKALSDEMWVGGLSALTGGLLVEILHLMTGHF